MDHEIVILHLKPVGLNIHEKDCDVGSSWPLVSDIIAVKLTVEAEVGSDGKTHSVNNLSSSSERSKCLLGRFNGNLSIIAWDLLSVNGDFDQMMLGSLTEYILLGHQNH